MIFGSALAFLNSRQSSIESMEACLATSDTGTVEGRRMSKLLKEKVSM